MEILLVHALVGTWTRDLSLTKGVLYRWATRAILKWAGLDQSRLPAAQWFWSVQNKFRRPVCDCQIISRECCNLSSVHFLQLVLSLVQYHSIFYVHIFQVLWYPKDLDLAHLSIRYSSSIKPFLYKCYLERNKKTKTFSQKVSINW